MSGEMVSAFWAGAQDHGRGVDLRRAAELAGGWAGLEQAPSRWLLGVGVRRDVVARWLATPARNTRGRLLTLANPAYPRSLARLQFPPPVVCVEGSLDTLRRRGVAVVGTRGCTSYGAGVSRHLGVALSASGVAVVSGLARGIDTHAHRGALGLGHTIAVLGHGLAHMAPASNRGLRQQIVDRGGTILTAFADDVPPRPHTFPRRNRWIVGLAEAVVVVEAPERSGAMITARLALEEGRDVYAVPGPLGAPASRGCLALLRDGAEIVDDVEAFAGAVSGRAPYERASWLTDLFAGLSVEEVARRHGRGAAELLGALGRLEVAGHVVRLPGQRYGPTRRA